jgi:hypothetical protein
MAIQGALLFPRSWSNRLIVKPQALAAGSLMLFAGAAVLLAGQLGELLPTAAGIPPGCNTRICTAANRPNTGAYSAMMLPRSRHRDDAARNAVKEPACLPGEQRSGQAGQALQPLRSSKRFGVCAPGANCCPEQTTQSIQDNEQDD